MRPEPSAHCEYFVEGQPDGPTLVFIHGWPDDASLWRHQVTALGHHYRCVLVTLPNFGARPVQAGGFDFPELLRRLVGTLDAAQPDGTPVTLVTHDWGSYLGYLLEQTHPERVARMVALDVGGHLAPRSAREKLLIAGYQWVLILLWLIGGALPPLGNGLTRRFARLLRVPARQAASVRSRCNYPYFYLWRSLLVPRWRPRLLSRYRPGCPVLFLWGMRKPVMFHSGRWLELVADSGGASVGFEQAGHWLQETHPEQVNAEISRWLES
ncbi:MAG: alpha/beta fold hydrolase [Xanthomonadales bacterium]|nr:alpha/beta fold hydrolase [Xanthomonadales bacterium]NIN58881.1 alpha/beta fold hydrolase [Xanthomonadales bacterium]NIN74150.1 alpha/beta fold hydrolase [Xanthomonadales bacterium]NIO13821.1 alpha/beta fold hydrolase [Xanthomonadales bacterium]NIP11274.1 alpha/beta fold hydrolase [Xanthomonadales bacterium]